MPGFEVTKQVLFRFFFLPTVRQSKTLKDHNDDNDGLNNHNKLPQKRCSTAFLSFITELTEVFSDSALRPLNEIVVFSRSPCGLLYFTTLNFCILVTNFQNASYVNNS